MPVVRIEWVAGRTPEQKQAVSEQVGGAPGEGTSAWCQREPAAGAGEASMRALIFESVLFMANGGRDGAERSLTSGGASGRRTVLDLENCMCEHLS
jgi:hypothetical protein